MYNVKKIKAGDIIEVDRILYKHYGIYAGDGRVIHYTAENNDLDADAKVRETSFEQFSKDGNCKLVPPVRYLFKSKQFSREETVNRARSRIGEKKYNLVFNNCEHFVSWCKYGENKSIQVEKTFGAVVLLGAAAIISLIVIKNDYKR